MFDSIGWGELIVLALAALFIFGPERLPHLAKDAAAGLKRVRTAISDVRAQVDDSLGDDIAQFRDIDLRKYHPRTFLREQLLAEDGLPGRPGGATASAAGAGSVGRAAAPTRDPGTPPPFDVEAT